MNEGVVVLHGIFRTKFSMRSLAKYLEKEKFKVLNLGYKSTKYPIEELIEIIHPAIADFNQKNNFEKLHFVGYSMGALLIRAYLKNYLPKNLGRVVMIGPPNQGSEVADRIQNFFFYKWLYGPAGQQLITNQESFKKMFAEINCELGIIAGNKSLDPISSKIIGIANDGKVSIESTKLAEMKEHIIVPVNHTFFPENRKVKELTSCFLKNGKF